MACHDSEYRTENTTPPTRAIHSGAFMGNPTISHHIAQSPRALLLRSRLSTAMQRNITQSTNIPDEDGLG